MTLRRNIKAPTRAVRDRTGRTIGRIVANRYEKLVTRPDQILRSPPGYGFDAWAMDTQVLSLVDWIVVENRCDGQKYRCRTEDFLRSCLTIERSAGRQYVLPLSYWNESRSAEQPEGSSTSGHGSQGRLSL
ncbi:MAG: hypothetical protein ACR2PL_22545 [Dehalococcoidia bacterium]